MKKLTKLVQEVLDELMLEAETQDGTDEKSDAERVIAEDVEVPHMGWLQEHDDRFHNPNHEEHGHFDPETMTCRLREQLGHPDNADRLEGGGQTFLQRLANAPTKDEFISLISRLQREGNITSDDAAEILGLGQNVLDSLANADEEGVEFTQEMKDNLIGLNEIYQALNAAYPQQEQRDAAAEPEAAPEPAVEPEERRTEPPHQDRQEMASSQQQVAEPTVVANETPAAGNGQHFEDASEIVGRLLSQANEGYNGFNNFAHQVVFPRHGQDYEWPFNRRHPINADEITEDMIAGVVSNLPYGFRSSWRVAHGAQRALEFLNDPTDVSEYYRMSESDIQKMKNSPNRNAKRFMEMVECLHPGWQQAREQRRIDLQNENARREAEQNEQRLYDGISGIVNYANTHTENVTNPEDRVELTEDEVNNAVNMLTQTPRLAERREDLRTALNAIRERGNLDSSALSYFTSNIIPYDHPMMAAIRARDQRRREAQERRKNEIRHWRPTLSDGVKQNLKQLAERNGLTFSEEPILGVTSRNRGYNCYLTALVHSLRRAGIKIDMVKHRPSGYGPDAQSYFIPTKRAMELAGWERVQGKTHQETVNNLKHLAETKPDGYTIECWSEGHHGTHAYLKNGKWYFTDTYNVEGSTESTDEELDSESLAYHIHSFDPEYLSTVSMDDRDSRLAKAAFLRELPPSERVRMTQEEKDAYVNRKLKELGVIAESSYGHSPEQGFTQELIDNILRD